ncbi:MAG TPA: hypothetical protein ENG70_00905 [Candidatus Cloacimonetes bacterium]|nr:hypothetical protein [Candidatus Cloacimonadota bacterium]HEX37413.1 hypothetical protein [Candidatus Cloacimonadota bacterium]
MKTFEEQLNSMKIPSVDNDPYEPVLRKRLKAHYFNPVQRTQMQLKWAIGFAVFFFVITIGLIVKPQFALKAHNAAFRESKNISIGTQAPIIEPDYLNYTSIRNPKLRGELDPDKYLEDKAYVIRKYKSHEDNNAVLIVSEFTAQQTQFADNRLF